jgi:hypothetical protein
MPFIDVLIVQGKSNLHVKMPLPSRRRHASHRLSIEQNRAIAWRDLRQPRSQASSPLAERPSTASPTEARASGTNSSLVGRIDRTERKLWSTILCLADQAWCGPDGPPSGKMRSGRPSRPVHLLFSFFFLLSYFFCLFSSLYRWAIKLTH